MGASKEKMSTISSNYNAKRIAKNTLVLYVRSILSMAIGLYTSRLLLKVLGVEDYGVYTVVGGMVLLFSFLSTSLAVSSQRFLNYEMGKGLTTEVNKIFCMSVNILTMLAVCMSVLAEIIGLYLLYNYLSIPKMRLDAAFWVLHLSVASLFFTIISVPYNALIIAKEDMRSFAYIDILGSCLKLLAVVALNWTSWDRLIYINVCKRKFSESKYRWLWDVSLFKKMVSFSGWTTLSAFTMIGRNQGIAVLYNAFYGVAINAAIGIANQVNGALNTLVLNFTTSFNPQIIKNYASGDWNHCQRLHLSGPKFAFFLMSIVSAPFFLFGDYILKLWLVNPPTYSVMFIHLILADTLLKTLTTTSNTIVRATGDVKKYEITLNSIICICFGLACLCFRYGLDLQLPFLCLILATIINNLYVSYKSCNSIAMSWSDYAKQIFFKMVFSYVCPILIFLLCGLSCSSLPDFIYKTIFIVLLIVLSEYYIGFSITERTFILNSIRALKNKIFKQDVK